MKPAKLTLGHNIEFTSYTRLNLEKGKYGYDGDYISKELGICFISVTQDMKKNYYLQLLIWKNGIEYKKQFECDKEPSYRLAGMKAKEFLNELKRDAIEERR